MTPPLSVWRKLDRYLLRNHPEVWSLSLHELHALVIVATSVLTLMLWLLPLEMLLEHFAWVRTLFMIFAVPLLSISVGASGAKQELPLTRTRWPRALSRWYFLIVLFSPVVIVSLIAQARFQPLTRGYDLNALPNVQKTCKALSVTNEECVDAVSRLTGRPPDQISQDTVNDALDLSNVVPDGLIPRWGDFLLLLLCMAYARQSMELISAEMPPRGATAGLMFFLQLLYPSSLGFFYILFLDNPPDRHISWYIATGMAVLLPLALFYVIISSDRRRGVALTWCWIAVLMGLPLLIPLLPILFSSPEQRLLHQAILLGGFLLLTPWLQRQHDRVRSLPL